MIEYEYRIVLFIPNYSNSSNSLQINLKVLPILAKSQVFEILYHISMTFDNIFCTRNDYLESKFQTNPLISTEYSLLTIQLFGSNYSNSSNSIRKAENERIRIPNTTIRSQLFE